MICLRNQSAKCSLVLLSSYINKKCPHGGATNIPLILEFILLTLKLRHVTPKRLKAGGVGVAVTRFTSWFTSFRIRRPMECDRLHLSPALTRKVCRHSGEKAASIIKPGSVNAKKPVLCRILTPLSTPAKILLPHIYPPVTSKLKYILQTNISRRMFL